MYKSIKRFLDIFFAVIFLVVGLLPMLLIAIIIKIDSKGPIFFKQKRYGKDKRVFEIYKFRTMKIDAPHNVPTKDAIGFDYYFTRIGKIIRRTSIDELPQLINILKGEMSFVGFRPVIIEEKELTKLRQTFDVHSVRPGLTGWAQVNGRDNVDYKTKVKMDGYYAKNLSLKLDFVCLLKTFGVLSQGHECVLDKNEFNGIKNKKPNNSRLVFSGNHRNAEKNSVK